MKEKLLHIILLIFIIFIGCSSHPEDIDNQSKKLLNSNIAYEFYDWLITESETYYDNRKGHWGQDLFGYRNMLTECYLRFDGYQLMEQTSHSDRNRITQIVEEMTTYYLQVADTIGTGVWGFPAEPNHPEIGDKMQHEIEEGNSKNGWVFELSGIEGSKAGMYYTHGQVLADISKTYLRYSNKSLLPYITKGAKWIINKNYDYGNINYFAAAIKGLAYAYVGTGENEIKAQALNYLTKILKAQNSDGSFGGEHDQEAGYHGIIVSCLAVARKYLPEKELPPNIDEHLKNAVDYLRKLQDVATEDRAGFVVQAWYYISCLADDEIFPDLTEVDWQAYSEALQICIDKKQAIKRIKEENNYIYQKEIQTVSLIGSTVTKYYYKTKNEYY